MVLQEPRITSSVGNRLKFSYGKRQISIDDGLYFNKVLTFKAP